MLLLAGLARSTAKTCRSLAPSTSATGSLDSSLPCSASKNPFWQEVSRAFASSSPKPAGLFPSASIFHSPRTSGSPTGNFVRLLQKAFRGNATSAEPFVSTPRPANQTARSLQLTTFADLSHGLGAGLSRSTQKQLGLWLGGCGAWVASMVVLGGLTRLTRSGLSMTDWKFTGERPPSSKAQWEAEFQKYQQSPEYKRVNRSMALEEFKVIYWMEYAHRMWGRLLGLAFVGPAAYFAMSGKINRQLAMRLGLLLLMGGTQGFVGWWMVRSGLRDPENLHDIPRVSPYRLAAHLGSAFLVYSVLLWTSLSLLWPASLVKTTAEAAAAAGLRKWVLPLSGLVAITGMSGAFVAGLDAGHAYNTFPLMGGHLVPEEYWSISGWRNAFENTAAVQFHHRLLAVSTFASVTATWLMHRKSQLPGRSKHLLHAVLAFTALQVTLGITTLLTYVPPGLGAAHQATALALFSSALALLHSLRPQPQNISPAVKVATPLAAAAVVLVGAAVIKSN